MAKVFQTMLRHILSVIGGAVTAVAMAANVAWGQNLYYQYSAKLRMPECRTFLAQSVGSEMFATGQCATLVSELILTSRIICMPKEAALRDAVKVIVRYFDARPARQQDSFVQLARDALRQAWPCRD